MRYMIGFVGLLSSGCLSVASGDACPDGTLPDETGACFGQDEESLDCDNGLVMGSDGICGEPVSDGLESSGSLVSPVSDWELPELTGEEAGAGAPYHDASILSEVSISYSLQMEFVGELAEGLCGVAGLCDCTSFYLGKGEQLVSDDNEVTFFGTWELLESDCVAGSGLDDVLWTPADGQAYHTFRFASDMTGLNDWIVHRDVANTITYVDAIANEQYWITAMSSAFDLSEMSAYYEVTELSVLEGLVPSTFDHQIHIEFAE
jgi:hypothetical protein